MYKQDKQIVRQSIASALTMAEQSALDAILPDFKGDTIVQLAQATCSLDLAKSQIEQKICIIQEASHLDRNTSMVCGEFSELPLLTDSIDVILLPHVLDFTTDYKQILRETWRILAPEGHAIIFGYHLSCLWGLPESVTESLTHHIQPSELLNTKKLRRLLLYLGFQLVNFKTFFYRPPINKKRFLERLGFVEIIGHFLWPYLGCIYMFIVKKPVVTLTPVGLKKRATRLRVKGVMEPTVRRTKTWDFKSK